MLMVRGLSNPVWPCLPHPCLTHVLPAGPAGKVLLMPEPNKPLIMVATGTGIAPFRAFWRRAFFEQVLNRCLSVSVFA